MKIEFTKEEAERQEALRPDVERIQSWIDECEWDPAPPKVEDEKMSMLLSGALQVINDILNELSKKIKSL